MNLQRLLRPQAITIVGGGTWGQTVAQNCLALGYKGKIWPVHPKGKPLAGIPAFKTLKDLPDTPDAAYICVNRHNTIESVRQLSALGAGGAICLASGFSEAQQEDAEAHNLQNALVEASQDMPLIGPNCFGFINYAQGLSLWPDQHGGKPRKEGIAVIAQSSNIALNLTMLERAFPLAQLYTVGNQAKLDMAQLGLALLKDPSVKALGLHIEGIKNIRHFETLAAKASSLNKPIIALRIGRSYVAQQASLSHTASLAGDYRTALSFLKRLGIICVSSLPEFVETLKLAYVTGYLKSCNIASMSCSGGEASLIADTAENYSVTFPSLDNKTHTALRKVLGPMVALSNPLDYHTYIWRDDKKLEQVFAAMAQGTHAVTLLILDYPHPERSDNKDWLRVQTCLIRAKKRTGKNFAVVASFPDNLREKQAEALLAEGIIPFAGLTEALAAIEKLASAPLEKIPPPLLFAPACQNPRRYEEAEAKTLLAQAGLAIPQFKKIPNLEGLAEAGKELGYPLVLKGEGFAHKSDVGAVALNLNDETSLLTAAQSMQAKSYLVETMVKNACAELIIGITRDAAHNSYALTLGAGGIFTELFQDSVTVMLPTNRAEIEESLKQLRISRLLRGYRSMPAVNLVLVLEAIEALQSFVIAHTGKIEEIEINPLLVGHDFALVADALIVGEKLYESAKYP